MSAVPSATIEDALVTAVVAATGLAADRVRWAEQGLPRPASGAWISLRLLSLEETGPDWVDVEEAEAPVDGAEIEHTSRGWRVGTLSVQCFAGDATGASTSVAILERLRAKLPLPTVADALAAANVAVVGRGPVRNAAALINSTVFEPRAVIELRFTAASEVTETGTYIETVETSGDVA